MGTTHDESAPASEKYALLPESPAMARTKFTRAELEAHRGTTVPDLAGPGMRLLFVGINPGLWTAAAGAHFARPGNRFWPALAAAGITEGVIDASGGMRSEDAAHLIARGVGITNLAEPATARADELRPADLEEGAARLEAKVRRWGPRVVAVLGLTAYRAAFGDRRATAGRQVRDLAGAELWALPNPSGLNAHETVASLAEWYGAAARAAGVVSG